MRDAISSVLLGEILQDLCIQNATRTSDPSCGIVIPNHLQQMFEFGDTESRVAANEAVIKRIDYTPIIANGVLSVTLRLSRDGRPYFSPLDISPDYDGFPDPDGTHEVVWISGLLPVIANQSRALFEHPDYQRRIAPALERGFADKLSDTRAAQIADALSYLILM